jgi:hypothetical protein
MAKLKLAYIALLPKRSPGIEAHIAARARAAAGIDEASFDFYIIGPEPEKINYDRNVQYIPFNDLFKGVKYLEAIFRRFRIIEQCVSLSGYDRLILRYPQADPSGPSFVRRYPVITEHHSNELAEIEAKIRSGLTFGEKQVKNVRYLLEARYGDRVREGCRGLIGVTDEIRQVEQERAKHRVSTVTIPNGINVSDVVATGFRRFSGGELDMAFVASRLDPRMTPWHGVDRVISGLKTYRGRTNVRLHLIGDPGADSIRSMNGKNWEVNCHGVRYGVDLDALLRRMHLAIGPLALHRKAMREACSLKVREYMARGLPFILSHEDSDMDEIGPQSSFVLRLPSDDTVIDIGRVVEFASKICDRMTADAVVNTMRAYACQHMDWRTKLKKMVRFAREL